MTLPNPPSDYHYHQGEALQLLRKATPTGPDDALAAANAHAALAVAAAVHAWHEEWNQPAPVELVDAPRPAGGRRIYLASSWRNPDQPWLVDLLREDGHEVYDFRNPPGSTGFSWAEVKPTATPGIPSKGADLEPADSYLRMIEHPRARAGFDADFAAMQWADTIVLLLPCGKSAHLELGWGIGAGKRTAILLDDPVEPELMYLAADARFRSAGELRAWLKDAGGRS